jgi:formate transporter
MHVQRLSNRRNRVASIGKTAADFPDLTWSNFFVGNLIPVTIGNIVGGSIMVAAVYWFVYLRNRKV